MFKSRNAYVVVGPEQRENELLFYIAYSQDFQASLSPKSQNPRFSKFGLHERLFLFSASHAHWFRIPAPLVAFDCLFCEPGALDLHSRGMCFADGNSRVQAMDHRRRDSKREGPEHTSSRRKNLPVNDSNYRGTIDMVQPTNAESSYSFQKLSTAFLHQLRLCSSDAKTSLLIARLSVKPWVQPRGWMKCRRTCAFAIQKLGSLQQCTNKRSSEMWAT